MEAEKSVLGKGNVRKKYHDDEEDMRKNIKEEEQRE